MPVALVRHGLKRSEDARTARKRSFRAGTAKNQSGAFERARRRTGYERIKMGKQLYVKGKFIGAGRPLICVPVMEESQSDIAGKVRQLVDAGAEMIEWRVDAFAEHASLNAIRDTLSELKPLLKNTIFIYTLRSKEQGGLAELTAEQVYDIHQVGAESHTADFIDVEFFEAENAGREIRQLQKMGAHVIASHHDFDGTPKPEIMRMLLEQMGQSGADVVKLAVMPQSGQDVLSLLAETDRFHTTYPDRPLVTMSMGALGEITRIAGETFGSCITFGADGRVSAPGQLPADKLAGILDLLHESMEEK